MKKRPQPTQLQLTWEQEDQTMMLEGEPVLRYQLSWPQIEGGGAGGRWINWYYRQLAKSWRQRWQREVYWKACIALSQCRAAARPFQPWTGELGGQAALLQGELLSLRLWGVEVRGDARPCRVSWGEVWHVRQGAPCQLKELYPDKRGWKRKVVQQVVQQGNLRREGGDCFLDSDWARRAGRLIHLEDYCLGETEIEFTFPQCSVAPAAEGTPVFCVGRPDMAEKDPAQR